MTQKCRIAMAGVLAIAAVPALGYEEAFVASANSSPEPTVVQVGEYSEGYTIETATSEYLQSEPVAVGGYAEQFVDPAPPARAIAKPVSTPDHLAEKR